MEEEDRRNGACTPGGSKETRTSAGRGLASSTKMLQGDGVNGEAQRVGSCKHRGKGQDPTRAQRVTEWQR